MTRAQNSTGGSARATGGGGGGPAEGSWDAHAREGSLEAMGTTVYGTNWARAAAGERD
jgi:hypothetical protein